MSIQEVKHFHVCGGIGSGAAGFNDADPSIPGMQGKMVCVGGIDVDARACADFKRLTGVKQTQLDLFTLGMYQAFHGHMPPAGWREATPEDFRAAAHHQFPDIVFTSMPCKGFSGLLSATKSTTPKYVALNELTLRGVWLTMEAFTDNPPGLFVFENVPRIASRGRHLLDQIVAILRHFGYAVSETTHDCGELGDGLAQSRKRFLLVARHMEKVKPFLYEPPKRPLRAVGEILSHMPMPGDMAGGPMHRIPSLNWKTWVRLAFVEAGSDWRSLNKLAVKDGKLRDFLIVPDMHDGTMGVKAWGDSSGVVTGNARALTGAFSVADVRAEVFAAGYGVNAWNDSMGAVAGESLPSNGRFAVADMRFEPSSQWKDGQAYGVRRWEDSTGTIAGQQGPGQGAYSVADVRCAETKHNNCFKIVRYDEAAGTVTAGTGPSAGGQGLADPRPAPGPLHAKYSVAEYSGSTRTVIAGSTTGQGAFALADPRPGMQRKEGDHYLTGGHYGVVPWVESSGAVSAAACHDNGRWSVQDPRVCDSVQVGKLPALPDATDKLVCRIQALDGTWHRPFTTLELAALQSIIDPEEWFAPGGAGALGEHFVMDGASDQRWREGIGNAVPRKAAKAIGEVMGRTILLARNGETFQLGSTPIWVRPLVAAITVSQVLP
ncbi:MAG: DNA cytosine methyltransferase [Aquabacterium sp.]